VYTPQLRLDNLNPLLLLMRRSMAKHQVHVVKCLPLRLRNAEIRESESEQTEGCEEDICAPGYGGEHVGGDKVNYEVTHPGCGSGD
jgi:hypothetical protein